MSNILKRIKAATKQARQKVTEENLLKAQFTQKGNDFVMGDLVIKLIADNFYYINPAWKLTKVKNMFIVSQLVYGNLNYGR